MLAEIAAANAAFSVIKKAIQNTGDITKAGKAIGDFVFAKDMLKKTGERKKNSIWSKALGREANDLEEFMALEELKQKEEELRSMMQLYGRGGLWNDYIKFCAEARKKREYQKKEREKFLEHMKEVILGIAIILISIGGLAGIVWFLLAQKAN
tara:strand:- start:320 stop:778 length:459 start_codon:yes stop_codon:yes gene_type:complete